MSLNYVMLGSNDVPRARPFYDALLPAIGGKFLVEYPPHAVCYQLRDGGCIWVVTPYDKNPATAGNGNMVGLLCASQEEVRAAHKIGLEAGGTNEGDPGPRPIYGPEVYGAYLRDLEGNKMSLMFFG